MRNIYYNIESAYVVLLSLENLIPDACKGIGALRAVLECGRSFSSLSFLSAARPGGGRFYLEQYLLVHSAAKEDKFQHRNARLDLDVRTRAIHNKKGANIPARNMLPRGP